MLQRFGCQVTILERGERPLAEFDPRLTGPLCGLLANDWGFWRTVTGNLLIVEEFLERYKQLTDDDRQVVRERLHEIQVRDRRHPKNQPLEITQPGG